MINYTWSIFRLDCAPSENGLTDVVKVIHWILQAQDENGITASCNNSYPLPSPTPEAFTDYSTLTEETVIGWLESNLDVGYLQTRLTNEIATQYNPPITPLPLPWVKVEEPIITEEPVLEVVEEMIADGYNPDAKDGDGDGLVQDTTKWERPVDTHL
jgi:hypothetical protein